MIVAAEKDAVEQKEHELQEQHGTTSSITVAHPALDSASASINPTEDAVYNVAPRATARVSQQPSENESSHMETATSPTIPTTVSPLQNDSSHVETVTISTVNGQGPTDYETILSKDLADYEKETTQPTMGDTSSNHSHAYCKVDAPNVTATSLTNINLPSATRNPTAGPETSLKVDRLEPQQPTAVSPSLGSTSPLQKPPSELPSSEARAAEKVVEAPDPRSIADEKTVNTSQDDDDTVVFTVYTILSHSNEFEDIGILVENPIPG
ncbi:MAG: hypothetical protein Q9174_005187 [Haloplaca sp. 1 TL-2023]